MKWIKIIFTIISFIIGISEVITGAIGGFCYFLGGFFAVMFGSLSFLTIPCPPLSCLFTCATFVPLCGSLAGGALAELVACTSFCAVSNYLVAAWLDLTCFALCFPPLWCIQVPYTLLGGVCLLPCCAATEALTLPCIFSMNLLSLEELCTYSACFSATALRIPVFCCGTPLLTLALGFGVCNFWLLGLGTTCGTLTCLSPCLPWLIPLGLFTPVGILGCMCSQPFWYPIERICFGALCPPNDILKLFETSSQILCCGIPPACHLTAANTCLESVANIAPCACINLMGNTTATTALSIVNSCCSVTWLGNIYAAQCGFIASACESYSPTVCVSGMATTWFNFCGSICQGTSPFFMVQCLFTRVLNLQQNLIVGCCGAQWLTPCFDTLNNFLANPFGCCFTQCTQEIPTPITLPIIPE